MVQRAEARIIDRFEGQIESVTKTTSQNPDISGLQYEIVMKPADENLLSSPEKRFREWVRIPEGCTDTTVTQGSILDKYLIELEILMPEVKNMATHEEAMKSLVGKNFVFAKKKLGRAFGGNPAKEYWCPISLK